MRPWCSLLTEAQLKVIFYTFLVREGRGGTHCAGPALQSCVLLGTAAAQGCRVAPLPEVRE